MAAGANPSDRIVTRENYRELASKDAQALRHACDTARWGPTTTKRGVTCQTAKVEGFPIDMMRAECDIAAEPRAVLAYLADFANGDAIDPMFRMDVSRVLDAFDEHHVVIQGVFKLPWPLSDREYIWLESRSFDEATGEACVAARTVVSDATPVPSTVRGLLLTSGYLLRPTETGGTRATYIIHTDPQGKLPAALVNMTMLDQAQNLRRIREQLERPAAAPS